MTDCHTLVVSDIHLGSRLCRTEKILNLLETSDFETLIINGDLFDSGEVAKLKPDHWKVIAKLQEIASKRQILLVGGNHGRDLDALAEKIGITIKDDYVFSIEGRQFLCLHGDQFDIFIKHLPRISYIFTQFYYLIQQFDSESRRISAFIKRMSKYVLGITRRQERMAFVHGSLRDASVVICSHTHIPHVENKNGILFINSGSFCDNPSSYVTISHSGQAELRTL